MTAQQSASSPAGEVPRYGLYEVTLRCSESLDNPFRDARAAAEFTGPDGLAVAVEGFYYGGDEWRVRFVPRQEGAWRFRASLTTPGGTQRCEGAFVCRGVAGHGFLRVSPRNPFRFEYEDGTAFYPIGVQTCNFFEPDFDGPNADGSWRNAPAAEWAEAFAGAVNLVRTQLGQGTKAGCALPLIAVDGPADRYDTDLAARMDETLALYRGKGMAQILILLQDMSLWGNPKSAFGLGRDLEGFKSVAAPNLPLQEQYIRYVVARFGCYIDIWEIYNEDSYSPPDYLARLAQVIRQADPYDRLLTTNYWQVGLDWCDVNTWHEYMGMPPEQVDAHLNKEIAVLKSYGKLVLNTEFGNQGQLSNVDPVKWRLAVWTAFMNESSLLFWSMSGRVVPAGRENPRGNANAYIGPDSRQHFRVLAEFTRDLPVDMKPVFCGYHRHVDLRTYGLSNGAVTAVYVHHFADHSQPHTEALDLYIQTGPGNFRLRWIDPSDGREVKVEEAATPQQFLRVKIPPVTVDLACRIDRL